MKRRSPRVSSESTKSSFDPVPRLAQELQLPERGVKAVVLLLAEGNTVPFIARYRKEATGALDEVQIRDIQERGEYLSELEDRRQSILESVESQGKLDDALRRKIQLAATKSELEDLYLPYKPKRRTRATIAKERGLEPLSERIWSLPEGGQPSEEAQKFVDPSKEVPDIDTALAGARDIVAERVAEVAEVRTAIRQALQEHGILVSRVAPKHKGERSKFEQYYDFREAVRTLPAHRYLAIRRGEREGILRVKVELENDLVWGKVAQSVNYRGGTPFAEHFKAAIDDSLSRLLLPGVETEVRVELKVSADNTAVDTFALNLENLLLAAPLGGRGVIGIDPGIRTGCKCASVDATGKMLEHITIFPDRTRDAQRFVELVKKHNPYAVGVGNGTGGRETEAFVRKELAGCGSDAIVVSVNEAGASVYSASDVAREEFPDLDLTIRGAISIARRLQDPLAELVKIDPRSIGVGQYQHDVSETLLKRRLGDVVESCVNRVGVELNTASASLLSHVAGIGSRVAKSIVSHREQKGRFSGRRGLLKVAGLGPRTYEQAAGFLRVSDGDHPLDASAVHPERYALVEQMAADLGVGVAELVGNESLVRRIDIDRYVDDSVGELTLRDIVDELLKPGRDPRDTFEPPQFREDVQEIEDLREGMVLEGIVTNVTDFGAFVDVGVHQDGLVHISEIAQRFVRSPHDELSVGQKLRVKVLSVEVERKRIALSAKQASVK